MNRPDEFLDGLCLGYDDGNERGDWETRPQVIIPKIGETALLLGLDIQWGEPDSTTNQDMQSGEW